MKLTVFNGSPRGKGSNTRILLEHFINGFTATEGNSYELAYLVRVKDRDNFIQLFQEAERVLLAFPLYTDAMPAIVKIFIESLEPLCGRKGNPDIGFIVQSGFLESIHSRYMERYLEKLTQRLGCKYTGTIIKGGVEGIRATPAWMNKKLFKSFYQMGKGFGETGKFDEQIIHKLTKPEKHSKFGLLGLRLFNKIGNFTYWDKMLKANKAFDKRFAKPYV
jgi:multimeric flavodoxin WrbA